MINSPFPGDPAPRSWRIGSLFTGAGGLDRAALQVFPGSSIAWHCENDPAACKVLAHHHPAVPNHGDITQVDWAAVEPVDVLAGGFPCQDLSVAGHRAGLGPGTRSGLWSHMAAAIDILRPDWVLIENVRGILHAPLRNLEQETQGLADDAVAPQRAFGAVLGDLASLGYDAAWTVLRAADIGACHQRARVFVLAYPSPANPRHRH